MTKSIKLLAAALWVVGFSLFGYAAKAEESRLPVIYETGNTLMAKCVQDRGICMSYIVGVSDAMQQVGQYFPGANVCLPKTVYSGQITDVVLKYLNEHPAQRHYSAASEISLALWDAFPCQMQKPTS